MAAPRRMPGVPLHFLRVLLAKKRKDYAFWRQFNEKPTGLPSVNSALELLLLHND